MNLTAKTLSTLLLGAALVTPALAQDAVSANNGNSATAQTTPTDNSSPMAQAAPSAAPTTPVDRGTASNAMPSGNSKMAMNTTGNATDLSSVPDTQRKYSRSSRMKDSKSEAAVTAQLNQKESSLSGTSTR